MKKSVFSIGALLAVCFLSGTNLRAQFTAGHIALSGTDTWSTTSLPANASSFMWYPGQTALRFGYFDSTSASAAIGQYSVAGGSNSSATGIYAIALGPHSTASGVDSFAVGGGVASGTFSIAFEGSSLASGPSSIAIGSGSTASNDNAIALGQAVASGQSAVSIGSVCWAGGDFSFAVAGGTATGAYSVALGASTATGYLSTASGQATAPANGGTAVGDYNIGLEKDGITTPDPVNASPNDPVFEVGNGDGFSNGPKHNGFSNAFTVYRDGTIRMSKACGGISMGNFQ